jgi:hypothetical protein
MKQRPQSERKQRAEDKSIIDHLTSGPVKPRKAPPRANTRTFGEDEGRELEEALTKRWRNGGLPVF